jgi:hypothetical protein
MNPIVPRNSYAYRAAAFLSFALLPFLSACSSHKPQTPPSEPEVLTIHKDEKVLLDHFCALNTQTTKGIILETVYVLFPNKYRSNNFIEGDKVFRLPNDNNRAMRLSFPTRLIEGKDKDVKMIKVLATKENIALAASHTL